MVFTTTTLFKGIPCPEGEKCSLTHCIFSHDLRPTVKSKASEAETANVQPRELIDDDAIATPQEPATKRRRVTYEKLEDKPLSRADVIRKQLAAQRDKSGPAKTDLPFSKSQTTGTALPSLSKPVSPPPSKGFTGTTDLKGSNRTGGTNSVNDSPNDSSVNRAAKSVETPALNPRLIPNDPAGHAKRSLYLKHLHNEMTRLNDLVVAQVGPRDESGSGIAKADVMTEALLVQMALDEEEDLARKHGNVYANVVKNRFAAYKRMGLEEWITLVKVSLISENRVVG